MSHPDFPDAYAPPDAFRARAFVDGPEAYEQLAARALDDPDAFWLEQARRLDWIEAPTRGADVSYDAPDVHVQWFADGTLNACYNCLDRHLARRGGQTAFIFEPDEPGEEARHITYRMLHAQVCRLAEAMRAHGVRKGDRVTIYLPMIPEAAVAMLACARIGAMHSVVFAGFSPDSLADRILDGGSTYLITADEGRRGGRRVPLKANADKALERCPDVHTCLVVKNTGGAVDWIAGRDRWYHDVTARTVEAGAGAEVAPESPCEPMNAEDPLFILYTSGSTGKPKGVLHTTGGYLLYASLTHALVFDYHAPDPEADDEAARRGDVFWCTADVGWVTGHSYIVYGPMANGATQVFFEGVPTYPDAGRFWQVVDRHQVTQFYTAPTAIRALMREGEAPVRRAGRESLRLLGTVGEPINPEAWRWYFEVVGEGRCPVVDTWWQTETGGILITALPGALPQKPGAAGRPFFGVKPVVLDPQTGQALEGVATGVLAFDPPGWPGQMRTVYGDHGRFVDTYFVQYPGRYFTGDGCRRDADGYYWITGRVDDVLNVSGHRLGTAEVESALVLHEQVAEAAVVGVPHPIKGQGIYAYVTLVAEAEPSEALRQALVEHVRTVLGPIAKPDAIQFAGSLPKTRSGKIMRRILRKIAAGETDQLGDTSTLADPGVVGALVDERRAVGD